MEGQQKAPTSRLAGVVAGLTAVKVIGAASGFVTGPLLAHSLGASGRGDLAAILVPLGLLPAVAGFGIPAFPFRSLTRGDRPSEVIASLGLILLAVGLVAMIAAVPAADLLAGGRKTVRVWLIVVFVSTPLLLFASLMSSCLAALARWREVAVMSLIPFAVPLAGIVLFFALGDLTVASAAAVTIAGALLSTLPAAPLLATAGRLKFRRSLAREGMGFGLRSWWGGLAYLANLRLDQFLMITAVPPRELGLYAVAATISGAAALATGALCQPVMTRIGAGETSLIPRSVRMALAATVMINLVLAVVSPLLLRILFGPEFTGAFPLTLVLLVAGVPFGGAMLLSGGLQADGAPLIPSTAEGLAVLITVGGLFALLKSLGAMGAALVSLAAYSTSFVFQLVMAKRRIGGALSDYILPTRSDIRWIRHRLGDATFRLGFAGAGGSR
ncbi:MAG: hypothetical protein ACLP01_02290 [Solirubrobacteraceae bacterium]